MRIKKIVGLFMMVALLFAFLPGCKGSGKQEVKENKIAALFPGSIQDADYNTIGYVALAEAATNSGIKSAYSEKVAVPDAERVLNEYINADFNIIFVHGAQFNGAVAKVAPNHPDVTFIIEVDAPADNPAPNIWYLERNYYVGFYVLGALASMKTETGKIGFIGGLELPFVRGEINAINQALSDLGSNAKLEYIFVGDFNDPLKSRQAAESLISQGADILISAVNLGNFGLFNAVKEANRPVFMTTTYTGKEDQAPENYLTSDIFNYTFPINGIVQKIIEGEKGGFWSMKYGVDTERSTEFPIKNVSQEINDKVKQISTDIISGKIVVNKELSKIL